MALHHVQSQANQPLQMWEELRHHHVLNLFISIVLKTLQIKLLPDDEQREALIHTFVRFNSACNFVSRVAFERKLYSKFSLQKIVYMDIRERFSLSAQLAISVIAKVVESYNTDRDHFHEFGDYGSIVYDQRILSFKGMDKVSINTVHGRMVVPITIGKYGEIPFKRIRGQCDLIRKNKLFYLMVAVESPEEPVTEPMDIIGVDMGIVNIAVDSTGRYYSGDRIRDVREHQPYNIEGDRAESQRHLLCNCHGEPQWHQDEDNRWERQPVYPQFMESELAKKNIQGRSSNTRQKRLAFPSLLLIPATPAGNAQHAILRTKRTGLNDLSLDAFPVVLRERQISSLPSTSETGLLPTSLLQRVLFLIIRSSQLQASVLQPLVVDGKSESAYSCELHSISGFIR